MKLDPVLNERARLLIMASVAAQSEPVEFLALLELTGLSKGNLSTHARRLEEAGYLLMEKKFLGRKPATTYTCTETGRTALRDHLKEVERMLKEIS